MSRPTIVSNVFFITVPYLIYGTKVVIFADNGVWVSRIMEYGPLINTEELLRGSTGPIFGHFTHCMENFDIFFKKRWANLCNKRI